jgi:uncharacterized oxidoreductase
MTTIRAEALHELVAQACLRMGAPRAQADLVAGHLVRSNLCGFDSHGVFRLVQYHAWVTQGLLDPASQPVVAGERGFAIRVDGRQAFGQVVADLATRRAVAKALKDGIAVATANHSNHVGRLADYAETIRAAGLIGLVAVNDSGAGQCVVPWGGIDPRLATNPLAMGLPGEATPGILFDFATSTAASGKIRQLLLQGAPAPPGWLVDAAGHDTTDPACLFTEPKGALLPFGGHKGYALSLAVEVLTGILSGSGFSRPAPGPEEMTGLVLLALNPDWFMPAEEFRRQVDQLIDYVKSSRPRPGTPAVLVPGEPDRLEAERRSREGIPLNAKTVEALRALCQTLGVDAAALAQTGC